MPHRIRIAAISLWRTLFDNYRPERHYMRGPGPKWRAKHEGPRDYATPFDEQLGERAVAQPTSIHAARIIDLSMLTHSGKM